MKGNLIFPSAPKPYSKFPIVILYWNKGLETNQEKKISDVFHILFFITILQFDSLSQDFKSYKFTYSGLKTHLKEEADWEDLNFKTSPSS